jgi:hypothetical protein
MQQNIRRHKNKEKDKDKDNERMNKGNIRAVELAHSIEDGMGTMMRRRMKGGR